MGQITCGKCGIVFAMPDRYESARREDGATFYCPNGHPRAFVDSETDKLRRERDLLKQQMAQKDDQLNRAETLAAAAKSQVAKLKKRAKSGTCPCCNRTFSNMAAHMKTKHPEFDPKVIDLGVEKAKRA